MDLRLVFLLSIMYAVNAFNYRRRCLLYNHKCVSQCPRNMHPYHTRCDINTVSQRTCDSPRVEVIGQTCGWSRCDCNGDLVLDELNAVCLDLLICPKKVTTKKRKGHYGQRRKSGPKKVRVNEEELVDLLK